MLIRKANPIILFHILFNFFFKHVYLIYQTEQLNEDSKLMKMKNENSGAAILIAVKIQINKSPDAVKIKVWLPTLGEN